MQVKVVVDLFELFKDPTNRAEIFDRLLCDEEFMTGFAELLVYGATAQGSWPNESALHKFQALVLSGFNDYASAELALRLKHMIEAHKETLCNVWDLQAQIRMIQSMFTNVKIESVETDPEQVMEDGEPRTDIRIRIKHHGDDRFFCDACKLIRFLRDPKELPDVWHNDPDEEQFDFLFKQIASLQEKCADTQQWKDRILVLEQAHKDHLLNEQRMRDCISEIYALRGEDRVVADLCNKELKS